MNNKNQYTITLDDDPTVGKFIARATGINSIPFTSGEALLSRAPSYDPAAVFIDVHLERNECGLDLIPELRTLLPYTPFIVMTQDSGDDIVSKAFAIGADDFIRKPSNIAELIARFHARIAQMRVRRNADVHKIFDANFHISNSCVEKAGKKVYPSSLEAKLLMILLENRGMVVTKEELKNRLWGSLAVSDNTLDKKISLVRRAFIDIGSPVAVKVIYGQGVVIHGNTAAA